MLDTIRSSLRSTPVSVRDAGEPRPARRLGSAAGIGLRFGWGVVVAMAPAAAQDLRVRDAAALDRELALLLVVLLLATSSY